jgi:hypothetical protein
MFSGGCRASHTGQPCGQRSLVKSGMAASSDLLAIGSGAGQFPPLRFAGPQNKWTGWRSRDEPAVLRSDAVRAWSPLAEPMRPNSPHQPAIELVEELSDVSPLVVVAPTTHDGVDLFYQPYTLPQRASRSRPNAEGRLSRGTLLAGHEPATSTKILPSRTSSDSQHATAHAVSLPHSPSQGEADGPWGRPELF